MNNLIAGGALCVLLFAGYSWAQAQQATRVYRVGFLSPSASLDGSPADQAFRQGLHTLGYVEGQNIVIEWRRGNAGQFPGFAAEMVRLNVDCIVTRGIPAIRSAKQATNKIPIVMSVSDDPVQMGVIASLARPGGNITGVANISAALAGKRLELLKEAFPKVHRVGHLWGGQTGAAHFREIEVPARALRIKLQPLEMKAPADLENAFLTAREDTDALIVVSASWLNNHRARIVDLAAKTRIPSMYTLPHFVHAGGLMSYAADSLEQERRPELYVDKSLKGAKPADLPVEQPTKFELLINLKTAKQIGMTISEKLLARADRVIK